MGIASARYTNLGARVATRLLAPTAALTLWLSPTAAFAPPALLSAAAQRAPELSDRKDPQPIGSLRHAAAQDFVTLHWMHGPARLALDARAPSQTRFDQLVADRITGEVHEIAPELLPALRQLAQRYPGARFELVSGYRSPKFNEMLRKKGRHVASSSQHSEGHAVDVRIWPIGASEPVDPFVLERLLRDELHWPGGLGVYPTRADRFVHLDVGKKRRWISK